LRIHTNYSIFVSALWC